MLASSVAQMGLARRPSSRQTPRFCVRRAGSWPFTPHSCTAPSLHPRHSTTHATPHSNHCPFSFASAHPARGSAGPPTPASLSRLHSRPHPHPSRPHSARPRSSHEAGPAHARPLPGTTVCSPGRPAADWLPQPACHGQHPEPRLAGVLHLRRRDSLHHRLPPTPLQPPQPPLRRFSLSGLPWRHRCHRRRNCHLTRAAIGLTRGASTPCSSKAIRVTAKPHTCSHATFQPEVPHDNYAEGVATRRVAPVGAWAVHGRVFKTL